VTDEKPELVNKWFAKNKPKYPIAILSNGSEFEDFLGVKGFPSAAVIAPDGKVSFAGSAWETSKSIEEALETAEKGPLWPKSLEKVAKLIAAGPPGPAYAEVVKQIELGKLDEADRQKAEQFRAYLEGLAARSLEDGRALLGQGLAYEALQGIADFRDAQPPFPCDADIRTLAEEIEGLPTFKIEMKGGKAFAEAEDLEADQEFSKAFEQYKAIAKSHADAKIAAPAQAAAERLMKAGMPGFKQACNSCRSAKRACAKHKEEVKL
jgi:hypothetical protein